MPTIKFERYERVSEYNKERRAEGDLRSVINDFRVVIDGEYRAILYRKVWGRGYWLHDIDHRSIKRPNPRSYGGSHPIHIESQAEFKTGILAALTEGLIPDAQTLEEIRAAEAAKMHQQAEEEDASRRRGRMNEAAPHMYEVLQLLLVPVQTSVTTETIMKLVNYIDKGGALDG